VRPGDIWVLSGSLPPGVPDAFYGELVEMVQAAGARALLDASGEPLRLGFGSGPYLVKPNAAEALGLIGAAGPLISDLGRDGMSFADATALGLAQPFLAQGVELVALSLGAGGLLLASSGRAVRARPPSIQARNPVGAGDALMAGVIWALERNLSLEEIARWGVAAGTAAAMGDGVALVTHADVHAVYEQVVAHALA
jgi:fructose-1-phosphate kinase PfkB-like protein